jgi:IclR family KDG regulon transcriptional repressor
MKKENYFQINSIIKVFNILEAMVMRDEWELGELVKFTELPKTTVHRMLLNMQSLGYVDQIPGSHSYTATTKIFELGCAVIKKKSVLRAARPIMEEIVSRTKETVNLSVPDGIYMIVLDKVESDYALKEDTPLGGRYLGYCSGTGKSVLAQMSNEEIFELFTDHKFEPQTLNSISGIKELMKHVEQARTLGYGIETEEYALGLRCIGAPIFNHEGKVIAGLSITAPCVRFTDEKIPEMVEILTSSVADISARMGYRKNHMSGTNGF